MSDWAWLDELLVGIDHTDDGPTMNGWWETSTGAQFGAAKLAELKTAITTRFGGPTITGSTSDGFHTFDELYEYRMLYNAALFNTWERCEEWGVREAWGDAAEAEFQTTGIHKSWRHSDGEPCFGGGWFIVTAQLPTGQISNHYPEKDWDLFGIPEYERAAEWDGHTASEAALRLREYLCGRESPVDREREPG